MIQDNSENLPNGMRSGVKTEMPQINISIERVNYIPFVKNRESMLLTLEFTAEDMTFDGKTSTMIVNNSLIKAVDYSGNINIDNGDLVKAWLYRGVRNNIRIIMIKDLISYMKENSIEHRIYQQPLMPSFSNCAIGCQSHKGYDFCEFYTSRELGEREQAVKIQKLSKEGKILHTYNDNMLISKLGIEDLFKQ